MKVRALTISVLFAAVMIFAATSASAQGLAQQARFSIPFDFSVDGKVLPAGEYRVIRESEFIRVQKTDGKKTSITLTSIRTGATRKANEVALSFRLTGEQYQLWRVWLPEGIGREVRTKRVESTIASNMRIVDVVAKFEVKDR